MPSTSLKQKHFFSMEKGVQMGKLKTADLPPGVRQKVKDTAKSVSKKAASEFANKVEEDNNLDFSVLSFREYLFVEQAFSDLTDDEVQGLLEKCGMEDEEPEVSKKITRDAVKRGGKNVRFDSEEEEPAVSKKITRDAVKRGGKEVRLGEKWDTKYKTPESKKGMFKGETVAELEAELAALKKSGPHEKGSASYTREKEVVFALRAKHGWKSA